jgi:hypothetical protein
MKTRTTFASKTSFVFAPVKAAHKLRYVARTTCIVCGATFEVTYGAVMATFTIGTELVGISCDACLSAESRARLASFRHDSEQVE